MGNFIKRLTDLLVTPRGTGSNETGRVRFFELAANGEHSVDFRAPDSLAATTSYRLPEALPTTGGQILQSADTGELSWTVPTGNGIGGTLLPLTPPILGDFAWVNQGGATATSEADDKAIVLTAPGSASQSARILKKTAPTAPYTVQIGFYANMKSANYANVGIVLRDSGSGKLIIYVFGEGGLTGIGKWNSATSFNANYAGGNQRLFGGIAYLQIVDDGANRSYQASSDGISWVTDLTTTNSDFTTNDEIGFFANSENSNSVILTLVHWDVF